MGNDKTNYCSAKFNCRAENVAQQNECEFFHPSVITKHENCVAFVPGAIRSCVCQKARGDALDRLIEAVKNESTPKGNE